MNKLDLIIDALECALDEESSYLDECEKALTAALELRDMKPIAYLYEVNKTHTMIYVASDNEPPPEDAYDEGTLVPLYALEMTK